MNREDMDFVMEFIRQPESKIKEWWDQANDDDRELMTSLIKQMSEELRIKNILLKDPEIFLFPESRKLLKKFIL